MTSEKVKIGGTWCKIYKPSVPTDKWVISLHGQGEMGTANNDGSKLDLVDNIGYPQKAKAGFEFPFNLICPQIPNKDINPYSDFYILSGGPNNNEGWFVNYVKEALGASEIIVTGISLGGRGVWQLLKFDPKKYIKAIAPVCGYFEDISIKPSSLRSVNGYSWHHQLDKTMDYQADVNGINNYNSVSRPTQVIDGVSRPCHYLKTLTTSGTGINYHADAWNKAYDVTVGNDSLLTWIKQQFSPAVEVKDIVIENYWDGVNLVFKTQSGLIIKK